MKQIVEIIKTELSSIFRDSGVVLILFGAVLIYGTIYPLIYGPEVLLKFPVAVVDLDNTPPSRELIRMFNATPEIGIKYRSQSLKQAKRLFMERKVYGVLYIQQGYEKNILTGTQNHVSLYADGGYFLLYSDFLNAATNVVRAAGGKMQIEKLLESGMFEKQAEWLAQPMEYKVNMLYNPYSGYATAIVPPLVILIVQQMLLIGIGMVGGTGSEQGVWRKFKGYSAVKITFSKAIIYLLLYVPLVLYMFGFQYKLFGYPMKGSGWDLSLVFLPYLLSIIFLGLTLGALFRRRETSIMVLMSTSVFFLMISGISWPKQGMPEWIYALGQIVPSSSGIDALIRIRTMGATLTDVTSEMILLWSLTGVYALTAIIATRCALRRNESERD